MDETTSTPLDAALERAALDPGARPAFLALLLTSQIFVATIEPATPNDGFIVSDEPVNVKLRIVSDQAGTVSVPFFTSLATMSAFFKSDTPYIRLTGRSFFELRPGPHVVLNPGQAFGRTFTAAEIELLIKTPPAEDVPVVIPADQPIYFGEPAEMPTELNNALSAYLPRHPNVYSAYVLQVSIPHQEREAHLAYAFEVHDDVVPTIQTILAWLRTNHPMTGMIDLFPIKRGEADIGATIFAQMQPFYMRTAS